MKNKFFIGVILLLCGCSYSTYYLPTGAKKYPATTVENVKFYAGKPDKNFTVIGCVASDGTDKDAAKALLRQRAASIGADAVIYINLNNLSTSEGRIGMNGVAVTFSH